MTGEEVMCTKIITLCTDEELKAELMKPELPTIPGLMQIFINMNARKPANSSSNTPNKPTLQAHGETPEIASATTHSLQILQMGNARGAGALTSKTNAPTKILHATHAGSKRTSKLGVKNQLNPAYCIRSDAVVEGLNFACKIVDDILIQGSTWPETMAHAEIVLQRCAENNMSISLKKFMCGA